MVVISRHHGWKRKQTKNKQNTKKKKPTHPTGERRQRRYLVTLVDVVVDQLQQEPHHVPQYEGGDQIPVDDVTETPYAPGWGGKKQPFSPMCGCSSAGRENALMLLYVFGRADGESYRLQNILLFSNSFSLAIKVGWIAFLFAMGRRATCMEMNVEMKSCCWEITSV